MDIIEELGRNKFLLVVLSEEQYENNLFKLAKSLGEAKSRVCYVCLRKPYNDVLEDLKSNGTDTSMFSFIDVLSSHYGLPDPKKNCVFIGAPNDLESIKGAIGALAKKGCDVLLFDSISTLLEYEANCPILHFTHSLATEGGAGIKKIFIAFKTNEVPEEDCRSLIYDLSMFADKTLHMS